MAFHSQLFCFLSLGKKKAFVGLMKIHISLCDGINSVVEVDCIIMCLWQSSIFNIMWVWIIVLNSYKETVSGFNKIYFNIFKFQRFPPICSIYWENTRYIMLFWNLAIVWNQSVSKNSCFKNNYIFIVIYM